jgi:hypothetical protein
MSVRDNGSASRAALCAGINTSSSHKSRLHPAKREGTAPVKDPSGGRLHILLSTSMKVISILGGTVPFLLLSAWRVDAVRTDRTDEHERRTSGVDDAPETSRGLTTKILKGCRVQGGKGKKGRKCPVPRRQPPPTRRPTQVPSASPSADVCLTYTVDTAGNVTGAAHHLYGVTYTELGLTWVEAQAAVQDMKSCCGGIRLHLDSISSQGENDVVLSLFAGNALASGDRAFLGLNNRNQASDATFVWDGTPSPFNYENWCTPPSPTTAPTRAPPWCWAGPAYRPECGRTTTATSPPPAFSCSSTTARPQTKLRTYVWLRKDACTSCRSV